MNQARQRGIFSRLLRSIFMIFTGYFALLGILVTTVSLLIAVGIYRKLNSVEGLGDKSKKLVVPTEINESVLKITIDRGIVSESLSDRQKIFSQIFSNELPISIDELKAVLRHAGTDKRVKAVLLDIESGGADFVTTSALRRALLDFRKTEKPLYVHLNEADTLLYYLASTATKINLAPVSGLTLPGPAFQLTYFGGALKKLGVELEVVRAGKFKSAMEPFVLDAPSAETIEMYGAIESSLRGTLVDGIAESRKKTKEEVNAWLKRSLFTSPQSLQNGLVDRLGYLPQFVEDVKTETKAQNIIEYKKYRSATKDMEDSDKAPKMGGGDEPSIAYIEASGEIAMDASNDGDGKITPKNLIKELKWARERDAVKAVVFRIDSPGGSALASDLIWDEVRKLCEKKPVVVSMGAVAASGGYYIAAPAAMIVAEPTTITGSIGVIGAAPKALQVAEKWGISFHLITQSDRKSYLNLGSKSSETDKQILGESIDETYNSFVNKVATGRKQDPQHIFAIAQGRVYTGLEASKIGLVDKLGGKDEAIREAELLAKFDPEKMNKMERFEDEDENLLDCLVDGSAWDCIKDIRSGAMIGLRKSQISSQNASLRKPIETLATLEAILNDSTVLAYWPGSVNWSPGKGR
ncbi:MAG: signal peptide peptidase SppA [Oligoflexus sp.]|nr:signal peptide peptidase SppA [Oligoflexus sp.]